jgi:hypothetical protein
VTRLRALAAVAVAWTLSPETASAAPGAPQRPVDQPEPVAWDSPSEDARGSMPLGNGDIALNAWVEPSGDLRFYIAKSDSWEDNSRLAKVGLVRITLTPALFGPGAMFRQELAPARGEMVVTVSRPSLDGARPKQTTKLRVWVDANHPVAHVAVESDVAVEASASFELWRTSRFTLPTIESTDVNLDRSRPDQQFAPTVVEPDTVLKVLPEGIGWFHHNAKSVGPVESMRQQDLLDAPWTDPILHRTFGAVVRSRGARRAADQRLQGEAARRHRFDVYVLTRHPSTPDQWLAEMRRVIARTEARATADRDAAHLEWWRQFWQRSHVVITPAAGATDAAAAVDVTRGYALQRYVTACAGRGAYPIKFNGSLFTVPWPGRPGDADYRRWGPAYWWQNTRLPYVPLVTSGDSDLLAPFHRMYAHDLMRVAKYRSKRYFGFDDAAYLPEVTYPWGAVSLETYGRESTAAERTDKLQASGWHKWEWVGGLELAAMLLDYVDHTGDESFLRETAVPAALPLVRWFDRYYETGPDGTLVMHPSQALETWWNTTNPMPEVAGLHAVIARLLSLPPSALTTRDRQSLEGLKARLPALPTREVDGVRMLAPAEHFEDRRNIENPELYAVFPFRLVSFEKPNASLGREALVRRTDRGPWGWRQEDLFTAYLGLTDEARDYVVQRARSQAPESLRPAEVRMRFPGFWGPNYDWIPDQCHGGVLMAAVQAMLLQSEGDKIFVLPAWPKDWNVDFKLHAPKRTIVEGVVRNGALVSLHVTPAARRGDVIVMEGGAR